MKFDGIKIDRVVVDNEGYAVPPKATSIKPQIIFKRNDGWTLGAPLVFAHSAYKLWTGSWDSFNDGTGWKSIDKY
jgi:hypothetical protein